MTDPRYNPIYEALVDSAADDRDMLVGLIAYGLYKRSKRIWIRQRHERQGRPPSDAEIAAYVESWTDDRIEGLKAEAAATLAAFAQYTIEQEEPRILKNALKGSIGRSILQSIIANLIYTMFLISVAAILAWSGIDFMGILQSITQK